MSLRTLTIALALMLAASAPAQTHPEAATSRGGSDGVEPASRAISDLLTSMSVSVLAARADEYLGHVLLDDPVFATEQRAWAADLTRNTPEAFSIELGDDGTTIDGDTGLARATLRVRWKMPGAGERHVSFPARFVRRDGRWLYAGRAWERLEVPGLVVLYADGLDRAARNVAEVMPEIMAHVHEGFEIAPHPDRVQQIKMYRSMRELQFSIYPSYTQSLSGWNEPGESIKLLTGPGAGGRQLRALLAHEYGHVASFLLGEKMNEAPWWVLEGVAELASEHVGRSSRATDRLMRRFARDGNLADWDAISDFHTVEPALTPMVYVQGHHMLGYISERIGRNGRNRWLRAMAQGLSLDEATREALGMPFADLDRQWRESLSTPDDG